MRYYLNGSWGTRTNHMEHPKNVGLVFVEIVSLLNKIPHIKSNLMVFRVAKLAFRGIHIFSTKENTLPLGSAIDQDSASSNK